jgi:hypothetical protein
VRLFGDTPPVLSKYSSCRPYAESVYCHAQIGFHIVLCTFRYLSCLRQLEITPPLRGAPFSPPATVSQRGSPQPRRQGPLSVTGQKPPSAGILANPRFCVLHLFLFLSGTLDSSPRTPQELVQSSVVTVFVPGAYLGALSPSLSVLASIAWPVSGIDISVIFCSSQPLSTFLSSHVARKPVVRARRWHRKRSYHGRHPALFGSRCARQAGYRHRRVPGPNITPQPASWRLTHKQGLPGYWITAYRTLTSVR